MESMNNLESILNEFYHHSTSNFRKKEIEAQLKEFQQNENSPQICIQNLSNSFTLNNQFLFFFSVSTLEFSITKKWYMIDKKLRVQIRDMLWYIYSSFPPNIGALQRDKLAQLIALIGKREFPNEHQEYVTQILSLTKMKFILGITLLKATSHEICSTKVDCNHQQKSKFVQSMILCLNDIMSLLGKFLILCVCHVSSNELIVGVDIDFDMHSSLPNDERFIFCCTELLNTIASMFSWTPSNMETTMNIEFFNNIYELSTFSNEKYINIHLSAIMTICELFYLQKQIPKLELQANGITELIQQKNLVQSPEEYQDKLTELLKLFIQQQWSRFVTQLEFPSKEFLLYLFSFTFTDNISALTFGERLSLWIPIIKSFNEKIAPRYTETTVQLISNIISKMQFSVNSELLDLLDTEEYDENMETELQSFRNNCIEIVLTASEIEPCKIFDLINHEFTKDNGHLKNYVSLLSTLPDFSKELAAVKSRVNLNQILRFSSDYLHCIGKDLTTLLQIITQTCNVILMVTCDRNNSITSIIKTCILLLKLANQKKLHMYDMDSQLKNDLIELQAQIMSSVRGLMLLKTEIYENHSEIFELIDSVMQNILPSHFGFIEAPLVLNSATQLMTTITSVLRPNYFLRNNFVQELFRSDLSRFDEQIRLQIKMIAFNALILPYSQIAVNLTEEQEYEKRGELLQPYVAFVSHKFLSLDVSTSYMSMRDEIGAELKDYEHLLNSYEDTNNYSKQILLSAINPVIKKSIELFQFVAKQSYTHDESDLSMIINFNLSIVKCLQIQLGSDFVINIVRLFLEIASTPNRSSHALNKLLEMLIFIVQHVGTTSTHLMSDVLKLTVDDLASVNPLIDISHNLFSLYDCILQNHWNYFQKNLSSTRNSQEDLMKIFNAYGQFLCNGSPIDPNIGRVILSSLENLNQKWHLYDKAFFKNSLLKSFMCTLLRLIVSLEGILFYDQIITIVFHMSEQNKSALHECLSLIFNDKTKIIQLCEVTDLPSFANIMDIIIQDSHVAHQ